MDSARHSQVIAVLFLTSGLVEVAVEALPGVHRFTAENSDAGLCTFEHELVACGLREPPFICMCMAPDAHFDGIFFEEIHAAPFPKQFFAQPMFLAYAKAQRRSTESAETLLHAFRQEFPRAESAENKSFDTDTLLQDARQLRH